MVITIGDLTNSLLPYANTIEMSIINNTPFIRSLLGSALGFTKLYLYIVQVDEHRYSVCSSSDDTNGNRFFPTGDKTNPFIQERDIIQLKFGSNGSSSGDYSSLITDLTVDAFFDHLYSLLFEYRIIRINPKIFPDPLSNLFDNQKIKRNIEAEFRSFGRTKGTTKDFIEHVIRYKNKFNLGNLKSREIKEVVSKLKSIGININMSGNMIIDASLEKYK